MPRARQCLCGHLQEPRALAQRVLRRKIKASHILCLRDKHNWGLTLGSALSPQMENYGLESVSGHTLHGGGSAGKVRKGEAAQSQVVLKHEE